MESVAATARARAGARTKLTRRLTEATEIGKAIINEMIARDLTVKETARKHIGLTPTNLREILFTADRVPREGTQEEIAYFLRLPIADVRTLLPNGGANPATHGRTVFCDQCKEVIDRPPAQTEGLHNFCKATCFHAWSLGRRKTRRPPSAQGKLRPGGRVQAKIARQSGHKAVAQIARETGLSTGALGRRLRGRSARLIITYALERDGLLTGPVRPALSVAILDWCLSRRIKPHALATSAGISGACIQSVLNTGVAKPNTIAKLSAATGLDARALEALALSYQRTSRPKPAHRPPTFTKREALRVKAWREESPAVPWPEIGRRLGWPLKLDKRGYATDCPKARRAFASNTSP